MKTLAALALATFALLGSVRAQETPAPNPPSSALPTATPEPQAVPLADVIARADAVEAGLQVPATVPTPDSPDDLAGATGEIDALLAETTQSVQPGALLETLRDLESRWQAVGARLSVWERGLTSRASVTDKKLALLPQQKTTWGRTRELAQTGDTPPEISQRIDRVLAAIARAEASLQTRRAGILSEQSRVADQSERVARALQTIRAAQHAAVSQLFSPDSPPLWHPELRTGSAQALVESGQASFGTQFLQVRDFAARMGPRFLALGLVFAGLAALLFWLRRRAAKWTGEDPLLERANRVLRAPGATAAVLTLLLCQPLFSQAPRLFWACLATLALVPVVVVLRHLIDQHLYPILNAMVVFYVLARVRAVLASLPLVSRLLLLLEMAGGIIFLIWFLRSGPPVRSLSHKVARAGARLALVLFVVIFVACALGYFRLANYLAAGSLAAAYLAIVLYAAAVIVNGLISFALKAGPASDLGVVRFHRPLIQRRTARLVFFAATIAWLLLVLETFSLRLPVFDWLESALTAETNFRSLHISLGAVLAFGFTLWLAARLSRFIRFVLEEDIYARLQVAPGASYAASTLMHYVILLVAFFVAIAALGVDMTKFTVLAGALGVGIGFGLQNIINNFVSGLILLFERPVNVGDVVQVGDMTGMIQRIGIRASIIRVANSSELIVPNSLLISEKVTNWTLSNRQRRIELAVGVAYGTDPKRVIGLLTSVAAAHPLAAKQPAPQTLMTEFGADSLNFDVRLWTDDYDQWLQIKSDVAVAISDALREAGIGIPYPQRDLHLRSIDADVAEALRPSAPADPGQNV